MADFPPKYFAPRYFAGRYWVAGESAPAGTMYADLMGSCAITANLGFTYTPPTSDVGQIGGNLGFGPGTWPVYEEAAYKKKPKRRTRTVSMEGTSSLVATIEGVRTSAPQYDVVKELIKKYEKRVQEQEDDDEEAILAMMW
jgi:hypothetical protein